MWGAVSAMTRERVCRLQLLMAIASAVIFGSESRGTRDRILLSQIRDFPFVVFYDSKGFGGGIRPCLHMGVDLNCRINSLCNLVRTGNRTPL
jgi:hypothetical protein